MTEKQQRILNTSIDQFIKKGYYGTSTKEIATIAEVSEGLIFKHFKNKEGLLNYILNYLDTSVSSSVETILSDENPKSSIKSILKLPFELSIEQLKYWFLYFKFAKNFTTYKPKSLRRLDEHIASSFEKLQYKQPTSEAAILLTIVELYIHKCYNNKIADKENSIQFLLNKYYI